MMGLITNRYLYLLLMWINVLTDSHLISATTINKRSLNGPLSISEVDSIKEQLSDQKEKLADLEARNALLEKENQEIQSIQSDHANETTKLRKDITLLRNEMEAIFEELTVLDQKAPLEPQNTDHRLLLTDFRNGIRL